MRGAVGVSTGRRMVLLGPQPDGSGASSALDSLGVGGPVALVTAGWEDREEDDGKLRATVARPSVNLLLNRRGERVQRRSKNLIRQFRTHRDRLSQLQELYRLRLALLVQMACQLMRREAAPDLLDPEIESAIDLVRRLDEHHLKRVATVEREYQEAVSGEGSDLAPERQELAELLEGTEALVIAGGHVGTLLHWLRLFDVISASHDLPIVAWSAGAMVLGERVVLFHDSPPQGPGSAEVFGPGLACCSGVVPFPHARTRLRLDDADRVALLARRFAPDICVALDDTARLQNDGPAWMAGEETRRFTLDGRVVEMASRSRND